TASPTTPGRRGRGPCDLPGTAPDLAGTCRAGARENKRTRRVARRRGQSRPRRARDPEYRPRTRRVGRGRADRLPVRGRLSERVEPPYGSIVGLIRGKMP